MTACHFIMSLSHGAPLTPSGGSVCIRLKSRISRRRAGVDMATYGKGAGGDRRGGPGLSRLGQLTAPFALRTSRRAINRAGGSAESGRGTSQDDQPRRRARGLVLSKKTGGVLQDSSGVRVCTKPCGAKIAAAQTAGTARLGDAGRPICRQECRAASLCRLRSSGCS